MKLGTESIFWVVEKATALGYWPAQRAALTRWANVLDWAERIANPAFVWEKCDGWWHEPLVVGPGADGRIAVHAGQCRLLGGLIAGKPVPEEQLTWLSVEDATRVWGSRPEAIALEDLVPMDRPKRLCLESAPSWLCAIGKAV